ncbi:MAG: hypothetical protein J7K73_03210 [Nanoarchaeota archaeon]|nr:hypothetical protein [Nanoarchaeota archaeon]
MNNLFSAKNIENIEDFISHLFSRNKELAKPALVFLEKVYSGETMYAKRWRTYITELFGVFPLDEDEEKILANVLSCHPVPKGRGKKPYTQLLKLSEAGKIILTEDEVEAVKRAIEWNSAVSKYYTLIKKLENVGLIKKQNGKYIKDESLKEQLNKIIKILNSLSSEDYTYSAK